MTTDTGIDYINSLDYQTLETKLKDLVSAMDDLATRNTTARKLRYVEVDIEGERATGKLAPDELIIPQHIIDSNIRREQSSYVQYDTQSPRAVVLQDIDTPSNDTSILERDVTNRLRFEGWQLSRFANIDGMQQNGYGVMELVLDEKQPGGLAHEFVQLGDLGMSVDTKDIQETEMVARNYYFSKTRLIEMCEDSKWAFNRQQVDKVVSQQPASDDQEITASKDKSLYKIQKVMFRYQGVVHVAWAKKDTCDDWIRMPRPLYIGRRQTTK